MKKRILTIGALAATTPVAAVVSCNGDQKDGFKLANEEGKSISPFDDGLYIKLSDYKGKLWGNKPAGKDNYELEFVRIGETPGFGLTNSVQLGDGDSVYMLYDDDNTDGLTPGNFAETVFLEDTSIAGNKKISDVNIKTLKNIGLKGMFAPTLVKFIENKSHSGGILNKYFGAQNNHMSRAGETFEKGVTNFYKTYINEYPEMVNGLMQYYGYKTILDQSGKLVNDPKIINHASRVFTPVFSKTPVFTYKHLKDGSIKITYHANSTFAMTAGHFRIKIGEKYVPYGSLSIGDENEWKSYWGHNDAKYVAYKGK